MEYEVVIGLEAHVQLLTKSKIFCSSPAQFGGQPNQFIDPLTFGLPGALPVLNKRVVESAIMLGLATNSEIRRFNRFARKHYFYPDLPKGYQISQFDEPICERGSIKVQLNEALRTVGIKRIHMEEDAGKSMHDPAAGSSFVDLNRAGTPLLEVVSEPDIRSPAEAAAYLRTLRQIVRFLGISDGNMEEGSLRCDANISLRPVGELKFGTRTEIKNINSFRFVERALEYEAARQMAILKGGGTIEQETRLFDSDAGVTRSMRSKEESADYRYFPDPDLPPVVIEESWIRSIRERLPKLPEQYFEDLTANYGLPPADAAVLTTERAYIEYFEAVFAASQNAKAACSWITTELFGRLKRESVEFEENRIRPKDLGRLIQLIDDETISGKMAKAVFDEMFQSGRSPEAIIEERGLKQITGDAEIEGLVKRAFDENPAQLQELLSGKDRLLGFFVGQVMKASKGSANPKKVNEIIERELGERKKNGDASS